MTLYFCYFYIDHEGIGRASFIAFCVLRTSKDNEKHFVLILFREQRYLAATDYIIMVNKQDKILKDTR